MKVKTPHPTKSILKHAELLPPGMPVSLDAMRSALPPHIQPLLKQAREEITRRFLAKPRGGVALREASDVMDDILAFLVDMAVKATGIDEHGLSLLAVGGYGRHELFPYSDIDLLFLYEPESESKAQQIAETLLYILWDLKLVVGHAVRDVADTLAKAGEDVTIRTALIDMRCIAGSQELFLALQQPFWDEVVAGSEQGFVEAKLAERDMRHQRCGDSRYVLEPNIKEGKGGLRDLHTLYWLARYCYRVRSVEELVGMKLLTEDEYKIYKQSMEFLQTLRWHLHDLSERAEERLTFDKQRAIARRMGAKEEDEIAAVTRFMKRYYVVAKHVGDLTRIFCALLEEERKRKPRMRLGDVMTRMHKLKGFTVDGERLTVESDEVFIQDPAKLIELFHVAQAHELDIHPRALLLVSRNLHRIDSALMKNAHANQLFMEILLSPHNPEITLRRMNEAGVLGRFIRDFGYVIGQMQFDMYHHFTVDEHTLFAIGILHGVEHGKYGHDMPVATKIVKLIKSRRVLYLALLCHDIAKGRGGDHSMLGEKVAERLATRFGFTAIERESCAWLVRWHLLFSHTAFKRDINDPKTINDFVEKVQSLERLRLLLVLTVADIRAVGPGVWNGWKGALLRDLYLHAEERMGGSETGAVAQQLAELRASLTEMLAGWKPEDIDAYLDLGRPAFWAGCDAAMHAAIARLLRESARTGHQLMIDTRIDHFRANTEITICTPDHKGLFSRLSGALALAGANIVGAKIFTLKDGTAVDIFQVQDAENKAFDRPEKLAKLSVLLERSLFGQMDLEKELAAQKRSWPSRFDSIKVPPAIFIENSLSNAHTVVEVDGRVRMGFLFAVTKVLADLGLSIATAHISTYGQRAVDVFYVKDIFGMKLLHEGKLKQVRERVLRVIG